MKLKLNWTRRLACYFGFHAWVLDLTEDKIRHLCPYCAATEEKR